MTAPYFHPLIHDLYSLVLDVVCCHLSYVTKTRDTSFVLNNRNNSLVFLSLFDSNLIILITANPSTYNSTMPPQRISAPIIDPASVALQERLHELLSRLSDTTNWVRQWPDGQDDPSIHVESTSKLITLIRSVLTAIQAVENTVVRDPNLKERLNQCLIPMDLIELLDHGSASVTMTSGGGGGSSSAAAATESGGGGLNPDAFSRGLLKEALGQLAGLKRRKLALEMLSLDISQRQRKRQQAAAAAAEDAAAEAAAASATEANKKRPRSDEETPLDADDDDDDDGGDDNDKGAVEEPPAKKQHIA